jgi:D-lactate dehydrogenase (cytochrome)
MDFVDLVVGSEGLFGLVTSATLRLQPCPAAYLDLFFSLPEESQAVKFYHYLRASRPGGPGALSAFEYFGVNCRAYMNHESRLFRGGDKVAIYIQEPLTDGSADDAAARWLDFLAGSGCGIDESSILLLDNARDREIFLDARHSLPANSLEVVQRRGTHTIMTDTVVPPGRFAEFLEFTHALIRAEGLDYLAFGHLGDCHLHFMILPEKDQLARGVSVYDRIVAKSAELGGVYSGEHGTGKRKRADFLRCYGPEAVEGMRRCKDAVDPQHLLNRGNVVEYVSA